MQRQRRKKGFTLAELLIVVAIIGVLSGVAFVAVARYQRGLAQLGGVPIPAGRTVDRNNLHFFPPNKHLRFILTSAIISNR